MATDDQQQSHGGQAVDNTSQQEHHRQSIVDKDSNKKRTILDRSLGTAAGLSKLLPSGTTLAFQTMAPTFTRGGDCADHRINFAFSCGLIAFLTLLTAALKFNDSVTAKDGKTTYYGVAACGGLWLFNGIDDKVDKDQLKLRRTKPEDLLHAVVSAAVFLALAFCDAGVQRCLVREDSRPWKDFFNHLPLAVGFLASFVFIVFPTTRKGIGDYGGALSPADESTPTPPPPLPPADSNRAEISAENKSPAPPARPAAENNKKALEAKTLLGAAATLSKLLPTGTTLAFQAMAPAFTNGGECAGHRVNLAFTWGLIGFLSLMCAALSFTDSVTDLDGHTYYGVATSRGLWLFNRDPKDLRLSPSGDENENARVWRKLQHMKKMRPRDFLHAVVSPAVFATVAFCDAGVQDCLVPKESKQWREFLALLPLAVAFLASFVFFIFPSDRNGIGEEGDAAFWHLKADQHDEVPTPSPGQLMLISSPGPGHGQHPHNNQISCCVCVRA